MRPCLASKWNKPRLAGASPGSAEVPRPCAPKSLEFSGRFEARIKPIGTGGEDALDGTPSACVGLAARPRRLRPPFRAYRVINWPRREQQTRLELKRHLNSGGLFADNSSCEGKSAGHTFANSCGSKMTPRKHCPGSIWLEVIARSLFFPIGLIYSLWRHCTKKEVCRVSGAEEIVYALTPQGGFFSSNSTAFPEAKPWE